MYIFISFYGEGFLISQSFYFCQNKWSKIYVCTLLVLSLRNKIYQNPEVHKIYLKFVLNNKKYNVVVVKSYFTITDETKKITLINVKFWNITQW